MLGLAREIDDLRLAPFVLSYVTNDFRCADDLALSVSDRRNAQGNVKQAPMLALPYGFIMFDALTASDSRYDRLFLFLAIGWN
jgi:hypothetical protein